MTGHSFVVVTTWFGTAFNSAASSIAQ